MASSVKVTRINSGIYDVTVAGRRFELERYPDGSWLTFEPGRHEAAPREYLQDYGTKRAAVAGLVELVEEAA